MLSGSGAGIKKHPFVFIMMWTLVPDDRAETMSMLCMSQLSCLPEKLTQLNSSINGARPIFNPTVQSERRKMKKKLALPVRKSFIFAAGLKPLAAFFS